MFDRKDTKRKAKGNLRKYYLFFVFLCLIAAFIGAFYTVNRWQISDVIAGILKQSRNADTIVPELLKKASQRKSYYLGGHIEIGYYRGILTGIVNQIVSGAFVISFLSAMSSVLSSSAASLVGLIVVAFLVLFLLWAFFVNVYKVVVVRMFLEQRVYSKVPVQHLGFLFYVRKYWHVALTMLLKSVLLALWMMTVVGGILAYFSYFAVPYILAENPSVSAKKAIRLSRRMMHGNRWECFKIRVSFLGWDLLNLCTLGIAGILYVNPYKEAVMCEYYVYLRTLALEKKMEDSEWLSDRYLFEIPSEDIRKGLYGDQIAHGEESPALDDTVRARICGFFGILLDSRRKNSESGNESLQCVKQQHILGILSGQEYGYQFLPFTEGNLGKKYDSINSFLYYGRKYSLESLIVFFAIFSAVGWLWEVSMHLLTYKEFANRGVLHGPWLPLYGGGGLLILLVLNKLRHKPVAEFLGIVVLCGVTEYLTGIILEKLYHGQQWWNYRGYFLNIDGRVCAEGLLLFGVGGMLIVYLLAPLIDNFVMRRPYRFVRLFCILFLFLFFTDVIWSFYDPNVGEGISTFR